MKLATAVIKEEEQPKEWLIFLHGILGSGANWRTFARQIVKARPQTGALLVDLRLHGDSQEGFAPPHTLEAAARDIVDSLAALGSEIGGDDDGDGGTGVQRSVLGHSFGGKVAIELARQLGEKNEPLAHLFVVDSTPGARPDRRGSSTVQGVVELLTELPDHFPDRNAFTSWVEERGISRPTAMWLAMNVRPVPNTNRFIFRIDIPAVRTMMDDYFTQDLWPVLENPPGGSTAGASVMKTHLIKGANSEVVDADDLEHMCQRCPAATVDVIPNAGHWVHVDAPDALRELVLRYLET